jgi:hypothetical protein
VKFRVTFSGFAGISLGQRRQVEDEQVMLDVRAGEVGKLELLFDRHHRALFRYFLHLTSNRAASEDLVQEVFFRILKYRPTYQPETRFCAWMFKVGRHVHMDHAVRHKAEVAMPEGGWDVGSAEMPPGKRGQTHFLFRVKPGIIASVPFSLFRRYQSWCSRDAVF